eukprot:TRINITY_DN2953_c0_g2_i2.p3 TRINITY_DN2953_c0_g2~~TRINITY_DN2953_c0_g2_i2.p3  ORF type:complete len:101 (+),score=22.62 TRINITY_DN2953_c0_g2_i2:232-534(+)
MRYAGAPRLAVAAEKAAGKARMNDGPGAALELESVCDPVVLGPEGDEICELAAAIVDEFFSEGYEEECDSDSGDDYREYYRTCPAGLRPPELATSDDEEI